MKQTLADIIKQSEAGDVREAFKALAKNLEEDDRETRSFVTMFKAIADGQTKTNDLLSKLLEKENTEFPKTQTVTGEVSVANMPDMGSMYEAWTKMLVVAFAPFFIRLEKMIASEGSENRAILTELLNAENTEQEELRTENQVKTVSTGAVRSRRNTQWKIATLPQVNGTQTLTGAIDGNNATFYLPSQPIANSETIRLNQGIPLSHGVDYTISGNQIIFVIAPTVGSQMEIRYQVK